MTSIFFGDDSHVELLFVSDISKHHNPRRNDFKRIEIYISWKSENDSILQILIRVYGKVETIPLKILPVKNNRFAVGISFLFSKSSKLKRIEGYFSHLSELALRKSGGNISSLVCIRLILSSFSDSILHISRTFVDQEYLLNLRLYYLYLWRYFICIRKIVPIWTKNLWY